MSSAPPVRVLGSSIPAEESEATRITSLSNLETELRSRRQQAYLVVLQGMNVGEMHKVEGPEVIIGRSQTVNVRLDDDGISRRHCRVISIGSQILLEDLGSANGTLVNGEVITHCALKEGDKISLGAKTTLKFTYQDKLDETFQQKMIDAALKDGLTGAYNKKFFLERLETEIAYARRHQSMLSLVMFDVDFFKRINDNFGHLAGDAVLVNLSRIAQSTLRAEDILSRYGGEEFAIICRGISLVNAGILGERLRGRVEQENFDYQGKRLPVTISVGIAAMPDPSVQVASDLIEKSDKALYEAKHSGRNRVCFHGV